jgi:hypothetical protein
VLVQDGNLARASFPRWWNDVVRDEIVLVKEGKLACTSFPHGGMMLFDMHLCLCKRAC